MRGRCAPPSPRLLPIGRTGHVAAPALESGVGPAAHVLWAKCLVREGGLPTPGPPGGPGRNHHPPQTSLAQFNYARAHAPRGPLEAAGAALLASVNLKLKEEPGSQEVCKLAQAWRSQAPLPWGRQKGVWAGACWQSPGSQATPLVGTAAHENRGGSGQGCCCGQGVGGGVFALCLSSTPSP